MTMSSLFQCLSHIFSTCEQYQFAGHTKISDVDIIFE